MKVDGRGLNIDAGLKTASKDYAQKSLLEVGRRISSEIISVDGDEVLLKLGNSLIKARNASSEQLYSGMLADFEVLKSDKNLIEIRPIALSALSGAEADLAELQKLTRALGVTDTGDNLSLLAMMMKLDYPISKANFEALKLLQLQTTRVSEGLMSASLSENISDQAAAIDLSLNSLLEFLTAHPKDLAFKQEVLSLLNYRLLGEDGAEPLLESESIPLSQAESEAPIREGAILEGQGHKPVASEGPAPPPVASEGPGIAQEEYKELELKHMKALFSEFKRLSSDENQLLAGLVSLTKQGIKPSMLNLLFANSLLKGGLGLAEAIFEFDEGDLERLDPELKRALAQFKSKLLYFEQLEEVDADSLEEMVKTYEELINKVEEGARSSRLPGEATVLGQHSQFTKDMQPLWQAVILPMMSGNNIEDLEIYVKKDSSSKSKAGARSDRLVYLSLKTANMDRLKIKIDYKPGSIRLSFFTKSKAVEAHIRSLSSKLERALKSMNDKQISVYVNSEEGDRNLIDFDMMSTRIPSKIDVRI